MIYTLSTPVIYSLELCAWCNNRCPGCSNVFIPRAKTPEPLSLEGWQSILTAIRPYAERLKLTGGEPTLHPQFEEVVSFIGELGLSFTVFSNGRWPYPERIIRLLSAIPQFKGLLVSLHGATAEAHEAFTMVPGSFDETVENIKRATRAGLIVTISTVLTRHNFRQAADIAHFSQSLGAHHTVFNRYLGIQVPGIDLPEDGLREAARNIDSLQNEGIKVKFGNCIPQCFVRSSSRGCLAGVAYCTIDPWGNVRPCNHAPLICGNLLEQPIEAVWRSKEMQQWREMIPEQCQSCTAFSSCHGGCRAVAIKLGLEEDPLITGPLSVAERPPSEPIALYEGLRPYGNYNLRVEDFGYVLLRGSHVVPVPFECKAILDMCDGRTTLKAIESRFGPQGLTLIASLHRQRVMDFRD